MEGIIERRATLSTATPHRLSPPEKAPGLLPYRFTVEQFHRMIDLGFFKGDRAELLEGLVVWKMTQHPPHSATTGIVQTLLASRLPSGWVVRVQFPITTAQSEPEPALAVAAGSHQDYFEVHPGPKDLALVVEVSDTTLEDDRNLKARIYARARIPVYWIVNIPERQIEVYTGPRAGKKPTYRQRQDYRPGQVVPLTIGGEECEPVPVDEVLP